MSISAGLVGKVAVAVIGAGVGGVGAYNMATTGCVTGSCGDKSGAIDSTILVSTESGESCALGCGSEAMVVAAAGESCESSCSGDSAAILTVAAGESCEGEACAEACETECTGAEACESECNSEKAESGAAITTVSNTEAGEDCALGCSASKASAIIADSGN